MGAQSSAKGKTEISIKEGQADSQVGDGKAERVLMKNMSAQMNRYGQILEKQRKRVQNSAMLKVLQKTPKVPRKSVTRPSDHE